MYVGLFENFLAFGNEFSCNFDSVFYRHEKPEEKLVRRFSGAFHHSLRAGGKGMGTPHQLRNSDGDSLRSFWRLKFVPQFRLLLNVFKLKQVAINLGMFWVYKSHFSTFQGSFFYATIISVTFILYWALLGHCR